MKIDKYITDLLYVYDCVVVPGFGGFVGNYAPAVIDGLNNFTPPNKQIAFNINLKKNDGLLADYIGTNESISFNQANEFIAEFVEKLNIGLNSHKRVEIEDVGFFALDSEGNLHFEQNKETNFLLESFGLSAFQSPAIKRESLSKKLSKTPKDRQAVTPESPRVRLKKYWTVMVAVPLGLALSAALFNNDFRENITTSYSSINPFVKGTESAYVPRIYKEKIESESLVKEDEMNDFVFPVKSEIKPEDIIPETIKSEAEGVSVEALNKAIIAKSESSNKSGRNFHIIGGCFEFVENAEKLISELKQKGFDAYLLDKKNGLSRVSYGAFSSRAGAMEALGNIKSSHNSGAWLLKK